MVFAGMRNLLDRRSVFRNRVKMVQSFYINLNKIVKYIQYNDICNSMRESKDAAILLEACGGFGRCAATMILVHIDCGLRLGASVTAIVF